MLKINEAHVGAMLLLLMVDAYGSVRSHACRVGLRERSQSWLYLPLSRHGLNMLRLRGGVSKYYNVTAPPKRGGIFIEPEGGVLKGEGQSVWNKGGWIFEERDHTVWCKKKFRSLISRVSASDGTVINFSNVTAVTGHALVTYRQGKKRGGVSWDQVTLEWKMEADAHATGTLTITDYYSDFPDDIEFSVFVKSVGDGSSGSKQDLTSKITSCKSHFSALLEKLVEGMLGIHSQSSASSSTLQSSASSSTLHSLTSATSSSSAPRVPPPAAADAPRVEDS